MEVQLYEVYQRLVLFRNIVCCRSTFNPETIITFVSRVIKILHRWFSFHTTFTKKEYELLTKIHTVAKSLSLVLIERTNLQKAVIFIQSQ